MPPAGAKEVGSEGVGARLDWVVSGARHGIPDNPECDRAGAECYAGGNGTRQERERCEMTWSGTLQRCTCLLSLVLSWYWVAPHGYSGACSMQFYKRSESDDE